MTLRQIVEWATANGVSMDANGTEIIYDDEIINTRYCGWVEGWSEIGGEEIGD